MGSILHITSQLNTERTYLHPQAVFQKISRGEPIPLGDEGEHKWAVPQAITIVQEDEGDDDYPWPLGSLE
jgi:hypothetical protein